MEGFLSRYDGPMMEMRILSPLGRGLDFFRHIGQSFEVENRRKGAINGFAAVVQVYAVNFL